MGLSSSPPRIAAILTTILGALLPVGCESTPQKPAPVAAASKPAAAVPEDALAAARGAYGADAEVPAYGDFPAAGGPQALVIRRLAPGALPGAASPGAGGAQAPSAQSAETAADVIHVSILARDGANWKEAFRADEHLKNRRGYLGGTPAIPVPAWHMVYQKTADSGFRLEFTPLSPSQASKQVTVRVAWNAKRQEYDSLDASGKQFLEPRSTPGGAPMKVEK